VREGIDLECEVDVLLRRLEYGPATGDAGIVDEDRGVAERRADGGGGGRYGGRGREIAVEVADRGRC
jgi:hypothetical protein